MTREEIVERLQRALELTGPGLAEAGYPERVQSIRDYIRVGEYTLAAEDLSSNLSDFACPVPAAAWADLRELSAQLGLPEKTWRSLEPQVVRA